MTAHRPPSTDALLQGLNEPQRQAVLANDGPVLVLAGAGSGKTRALTRKIAWLVAHEGLAPWQILAVTFTNRAAREMRERVGALLGEAADEVWLSTFHGLGARLLRRHGDLMGVDRRFTIYDADDQKAMVKRCMRELNLSTDRVKPPVVASYIQHAKLKAQLPSDPELPHDAAVDALASQVYTLYEQRMREAGAVDFSDLILLPLRLFQRFPVVASEYKHRWRFVLVDEFQDTNRVQYDLLRAVLNDDQRLCVVGDDDQSIYGWRGAHVRNILEFEQDFPSATVIRLEQNYRSRAPILDAANALIEHNRSRLGKRLEATRGDGEAVQVLDSSDENEEANKVATQIKKRMEQGARAEQIAVLYRINAMSRSLEDGLRRAGINYRLVGGVRFYERAEIKDLISYLRVITNPHDDFSIKRIINRPKRGIGKASLEKLEKEGYARSVSIYELLRTISDAELTAMVRKKSATALRQFITTIDDARDQAQASLYRFIDELETLFGLRAFYAATPEGDERIHNIDEFYGYFRDFVKLFPEASLDDFLNDVSLQSDQDEVEGESIYIMSIHASKGLEFDHLFIIGLEEGFLPLIGENNDIEEERRLGYVAFTRARETLCLSHVQSRYYNGRRTVLNKSRFIGEGGLCEGSLKVEKRAAFKKGDLVRHKIFGPGRVTGVNRDGREFLLTINFSGNVRNIVSTYVERL